MDSNPAPSATEAQSKRADVLTGLGLALLAFAAYAASLRSGFTGDDGMAISNNPVIHGEVPWTEAWSRDFWGNLPPTLVGTYRPLPVLWQTLLWKWGGGEPWAFHLSNVTLHALVIWATFTTFLQLAARRVAVAATLLALCFCAASEAVEASVGCADLLGALAAVLAVALFRTPGRRAGVGAALAFGLGLFCKESGLMVLPLWAVLAWLVPAPPSRRWGRWAGALAGVAVNAAARWHALGKFSPVIWVDDNPLFGQPWPLRFLGASRIFAERYVPGILDPGRRLYECTYQCTRPAEGLDGLAWLGLLAVLGVGVAPLLLRRRSPVAAAGLAWFVLFFLPSSNLVVLSPSPYAERLLYLPGLGLMLALAALVEQGSARLRSPWPLRGVLAVWGLANLVLLQLRHLEWRDNEALYFSNMEYGGESSARSQLNVGVIFEDRKEYAQAEPHLRRAVALWPKYHFARDHHAMVLLKLGAADEAAAESKRAEAGGWNYGFVNYTLDLIRLDRLEEARDGLQRRMPQVGAKSYEDAHRLMVLIESLLAKRAAPPVAAP